MMSDLFKIREAASLLHVHENTLRKWVKDGKIGIYKLSERKTLISQEEINRFLNGKNEPAESITK